MKKFILFLVLCIFNFSIFAEDLISESSETVQEQNDSQVLEDFFVSEIKFEDFVVSEVKFVGLKKTKESFLLQKYNKYIGKKISEIDIHVLKTELQLEGIFETYEIEFKENSLVINVSEKLTFIPLPFAMYSSSGFMAGLMVMDTNAFGIKDMFMFGGFYASDAITAMAMFSQPQKNLFPGFSIFTSFSKNEPEVKNISDDSVLEYENFGFGANVTFSEKIGKFNSVNLSLGFNKIYADSDSDVKVSSVDSDFILSTSLGYNISSSDWNGIFLSSNSISVSGGVAFNLGLDSDSDISKVIQKYSFSSSFQKPLFSEKLRFDGNFSGALINSSSEKSAHIASYLGRGNGGVSILPGNFRTNGILGATLGAEFAIKKFSFGLLSAFAKYEIALANDFALLYNDDSDVEFCHGPNGGIRFYLSKIAFPALACGLSYNIPKNYAQFSFAMGINF